MCWASLLPTSPAAVTGSGMEDLDIETMNKLVGGREGEERQAAQGHSQRACEPTANVDLQVRSFPDRFGGSRVFKLFIPLQILCEHDRHDGRVQGCRNVHHKDGLRTLSNEGLAPGYTHSAQRCGPPFHCARANLVRSS